MIKTGTKLKHPQHGVMVVTRVHQKTIREFIPELNRFENGYQIEAKFDKYIPGVRWTTPTGTGRDPVSMLIFHSFYLSKLEEVTDDEQPG